MPGAGGSGARLLGAALLLAALPPAAAERPWQALQHPTADAVLAAWRDPPSEYGPEPYYGMDGVVTIETLRADLDRMKALGFRAVTVQYGKGSPFAYLSAEHMRLFKAFVAEAKTRDMRIWIVDDAGYPSGFAGGRFSAERPELRMQALLPGGRWTVAAGDTLDVAAPDGFVVATAFNTAGETRDVPVMNGRLRWQAPPGEWTVNAVVHAFKTSPTRSDTNPSGAKDESQSLQDYLDPAATRQYLAFTHETYKQAVGDEFGKTILGFRGDEPDYTIPGLPWTPALFDRFRAEKGYDVRPLLPAFLQPGGMLSGEAGQARADYYDVFSRMFADNFMKPQADWCAANGLEYQVHLNHEERQIEFAHSEGDFFRAFAAVQVPGVDAIWHQIWTDTISDFPRFATSVAHLEGRPRAFTESFAAYRPQPDLAMARYIIDQQLVRGINLVEMMLFPSSAGRARPLAPYMVDPGFPAWAAYIRRLSYAMTMGRPDAHVALLQPRQALWNRDARADAMLVSTERLLSESQIDFDIVDEDAVATRLTAGRGSFTTASGNSYRTVIVPLAESLPQTVVDRLRAFAAGGGKVLFLGGAPTRVTGRSYRQPRFVRPGEFAWATVAPGTLPPVPTPPYQPPAAPPPPFAVPPSIAAAVQAAVGDDDLKLAAPNPGLRSIHRRLADASVYLLFNEAATPLAADLLLRGGRRVERWNPATGTAAAIANATPAGEGVRLPLTLAPYTTALLVVR